MWGALTVITWKLSSIAVGLLAIACAAGLYSALERPGSPQAAATRSSPGPALAVPLTQISDSDLSLMTAYGDHVTVVPSSDASVRTEVKVDEQTALNAISPYFSFLHSSRVASATLVTLTDSKYGAVAGNPATSRASTQPVIQNRLVWLFVFDNFNMPEMGPIRSALPSAGPALASRMWVAVDAATGDVLGGRSIQGPG